LPLPTTIDVTDPDWFRQLMLINQGKTTRLWQELGAEQGYYGEELREPGPTPQTLWEQQLFRITGKQSAALQADDWGVGTEGEKGIESGWGSGEEGGKGTEGGF